ncbi:MAG: thioesterase family protein [Myxococcota bacterium]
MTRFDRDTAVTRVDDGVFEATIDPGWRITRGPNGGYVSAILLRALTEAVDDPGRAPRTFTVHFTAPPEEAPVRIETAIERSGRSLTTVSGRMFQEGRLCAVTLAAFSRSWPGPEFQDVTMPEVAPPEEAEHLTPGTTFWIPMRARYEQHALCLGPDDRALDGGWVRLEEPRLADALLVAALASCWPPSVRSKLPEGLPRGVPTVELTIHFRTTLPLPEAKPDDFYLARFGTGVAREGFFEEEGEIWSRSGILVAQSRQLGLFL